MHIVKQNSFKLLFLNHIVKALITRKSKEFKGQIFYFQPIRCCKRQFTLYELKEFKSVQPIAFSQSCC